MNFSVSNNVKSSTPLLSIGFLVIFFLAGLFAVVALQESKEIAQFTNKMYRHPLAVSNAVLQANADIIAMHRHMKDVALAENDAQLDQAIVLVDTFEQDVYRQFELVRERFLGQQAKIGDAYKAFVDWKSIRAEVIQLQRSGKRLEAAAITKGKGAVHVQLLNTRMNALIDFARKKASEFLAKSNSSYDDSRLKLLLLLVLILIVGISTAIYVIVRLRAAERARETSEWRMRAIIENAADGIVVINQWGIVESFSPAAEVIFGYKESEVVGNNIKMLMPNPFQNEHDDYLRRYLESREVHIVGQNREVIGLRKDGCTFPMDLAVGEVQIGNELLYTGIVRDITHRKEVEQALDEARDSAEEANKAKSDFLANMYFTTF